ncbi:heterokaryon incompatibility protein [Colletotrichum plurivorum]|uniref:Heterokaryon incompatibility protein n=1 Tax=Colletotrichum plurivorum TaxID=2175906 RepID=A0A8H6KA09_9PEZI|nr:heterokaryon incompatibility protein [Colletotrichum plurivorum]
MTPPPPPPLQSPQSSWPSPYPYKGLTGSQIRVIRIVPSNDGKINCCLQHVALDEAPHYHALSYVWGNPKVKELISLDGHDFFVTANLYSALGKLQSIPPRDGHSFNLFWIDAICVNQADTEEKNVQVPRMDAIYMEADLVFIWLSIVSTKEGSDLLATTLHKAVRPEEANQAVQQVLTLYRQQKAHSHGRMPRWRWNAGLSTADQRKTRHEQVATRRLLPWNHTPLVPSDLDPARGSSRNQVSGVLIYRYRKGRNNYLGFSRKLQLQGQQWRSLERPYGNESLGQGSTESSSIRGGQRWVDADPITLLHSVEGCNGFPRPFVRSIRHLGNFQGPFPTTASPRGQLQPSCCSHLRRAYEVHHREHRKHGYPRLGPGPFACSRRAHLGVRLPQRLDAGVLAAPVRSRRQAGRFRRRS